MDPTLMMARAAMGYKPVDINRFAEFSVSWHRLLDFSSRLWRKS